MPVTITRGTLFRERSSSKHAALRAAVEKLVIDSSDTLQLDFDTVAEASSAKASLYQWGNTTMPWRYETAKNLSHKSFFVRKVSR